MVPLHQDCGGKIPAMQTVGVVGAGATGQGVAQALALTGHGVVLVDLTDELLERARAAIARSLRFATLLGGRAEPGAAERIGLP